MCIGWRFTIGLTSYDAAYLELAQRLGLPLATLDAELIGCLPERGNSVALKLMSAG